MAPLALRAGARPRLGEGGVAVAEGGVVALGQRVAPVRVAVTQARPGVAVVAHLAGGAVAPPRSADARLRLAARRPLSLLLRGASVFACAGVRSAASTSC